MKRLFRSRENRIIAGVAGGLAEYFDVDISLVRLLWILAVLLGGSGVLAYIIAWVIIPEETTFSGNRENSAGTARNGPDLEEAARGQDPPKQQNEEAGSPELVTKKPLRAEGRSSSPVEGEEELKARRRRHAGLILIGLGIIFLVRQVLPSYIFYYTWPLLIILVGIFFLMRDGRRSVR